jgi:hypothetical protein
MKSDQTTDVFNRGSSRNNRGGCVRQNGQTGSDASSEFRGGVEQQVVCAAVERDGSDNLNKELSLMAGLEEAQLARKGRKGKVEGGGLVTSEYT